MEEEKQKTIKLTIKQRGTAFTVEINPESTTPMLKQKIKDQSKLDPDEQRLIYKGHILKDDETLDSLDIKNGATLDLIQKKKPVVETKKEEVKGQPMPQMSAGGHGLMNKLGYAAPPAGSSTGLEAAFNSPFYKAMIESMLSNPELMRSMMQSDPVTAQLMQQHPEMEYVLSNPSMMRSMLSPDMMQMASGMMQRMRNLPTSTTMSGTPESFPMPGSPDKKESESTPAKAEANAGAAPQQRPPFPNPWGMFGMNPPPGGPATGQMPFAYNPFAQMMGMMGRPPTMGGTPPATAPATPPVDYKTKYAAELAMMKDMGFPDEEANVKALKETNGDVFEAIDKISNLSNGK